MKYNREKITVITEGSAPRVRNDDSFIDQTYFVTMPVSSHFDLMFGQYIFCCMEVATPMCHNSVLSKQLPQL